MKQDNSVARARDKKVVIEEYIDDRILAGNGFRSPKANKVGKKDTSIHYLLYL